MDFKLMFITNDEQTAVIAQESGVDWIFVDLEINGKVERQGHLDTVISRHTMEDVTRIKSVLTDTKLLVRVNPIYEGSKDEINQVIDKGADIVMLPYFKTRFEVEKFISLVNKRAKVCLLLETPQAVEVLDDILQLSGIDFVHIGLNDLHLGYHMKFMFELLSNGTVEQICKKLSSYQIPYGFGGIARLGQGTLQAQYILAEHYRMGSSMAILSRTFCDTSKMKNQEEIKETFSQGIQEIRDYIWEMEGKNAKFFKDNKMIVRDIINQIIEN